MGYNINWITSDELNFKYNCHQRIIKSLEIIDHM